MQTPRIDGKRERPTVIGNLGLHLAMGRQNTKPNPRGCCGVYKKLQFHGVETYVLMKIKGTVALILQHLNQTRKEQNTTNTQYNFNALGLVRNTVPQFGKSGALKGATITLITNGGTFSTLEFLPNAQSASNALQRLTEQKTQCDPEQCPQDH